MRCLQARGGDRLSEDAFEALMDHFEKALQAALQQRSELWAGLVSGAVSALPDVADVLPLEQALQGQVRSSGPASRVSAGSQAVGPALPFVCKNPSACTLSCMPANSLCSALPSTTSSALVWKAERNRINPLQGREQAASDAATGAAYGHWARKRARVQRPLLQRLWFEPPWVGARRGAASKEAWGPHSSTTGITPPGAAAAAAWAAGVEAGRRLAEAEPGHVVPFMGKDAPRPATRPRRMDAEDAQLKLEAIRCGGGFLELHHSLIVSCIWLKPGLPGPRRSAQSSSESNADGLPGMRSWCTRLQSYVASCGWFVRGV
jgi:hypothetical protein